MPTVSSDLISALTIGDFGNDRPLVQELFRRPGWRLIETPSRRSAARCLKHYPVQVVLAQCDGANWNWKEILSDLRRIQKPPQLVVASRSADDFLWSEVLNFGAYDLLALPLIREEIERVIEAARRHYDYRPQRARAAAAAAASSAA